MSEDLSDGALLRLHASGDPHAFGTLVHRHQDRLWAVALRTLGNRDDAADALQDALLSAHRAAGTFRGDAAVTTWLHRIVVNACLDQVRRRQARPTVPLPADDRLAPASDALSQRELRVDLETALGRLPTDQRVAIVLVDIQRLPVDEAAAVLGVPAGTVKSRCARGRARLAGLLAEHAPGNPAAAGRVQPDDRIPREAKRGPDA